MQMFAQYCYTHGQKAAMKFTHFLSSSAVSLENPSPCPGKTDNGFESCCQLHLYSQEASSNSQRKHMNFCPVLHFVTTLIIPDIKIRTQRISDTFLHQQNLLEIKPDR